MTSLLIRSRALFVGLIVAFGFLTAAFPAYAANGDITINVQNELPINVQGATVSIECPGGTYTALTGTTDSSGNITVASASVPAGANCGNTEGIDIRAAMSGYVTTTLASTTSTYTYLTGAGNSYNVTGVKYALKLVIADELGTSQTVTSTTGTFNGALPDAYGGGPYIYFVQTGTHAVSINMPGFVNSEVTNTGLGSVTLTSASQTVITLGANSPLASVTSGASNLAKGLVYVLTAPTNSPGGNVFHGPPSVTMAGGSLATSVHYTTDGTTPTCSTGTTYSTAVTIPTNTTLKSIACYPSTSSAVTTDVYSGASGGGGGGSSGSSSSTPPPPAPHATTTPSSAGAASSTPVAATTTTPAATSTAPTSDQQKMLASLQSQLAGLTQQAGAQGMGAMGTTSASFLFTRNLYKGLIANDVLKLQAFLNAHGFAVASSSSGSSGHETTFFGAGTRAALAKYQASVGITPASGYLGAKTRAYISAHP